MGWNGMNNKKRLSKQIEETFGNDKYVTHIVFTNMLFGKQDVLTIFDVNNKARLSDVVSDHVEELLSYEGYSSAIQANAYIEITTSDGDLFHIVDWSSGVIEV
jgi:hypothetical protein